MDAAKITDITMTRIADRLAEFGLRLVTADNGLFEVYRGDRRLDEEEILRHCALERGLSDDEARAFSAAGIEELANRRR